METLATYPTAQVPGIIESLKGEQLREKPNFGARSILFLGVWIYIPLFVLFLAFAYWAVASENDFSFYWRDPAAIVNTSPWIGLLSNIGVFIWWIAAVICVFTALILWRLPGERRHARFLLTFGLFTGVMALDDFFMIHEWVIPTYLPLSADFTFGVYILVGVMLLVAFRDEIRISPYPVLLLAGLCLLLSIAVDVLVFDVLQRRGMYPRLVLNLEYIVEDGLKLVGLIAWLHYFALTCFEAIHRVIPRKSTS